eukprot:tig00020723_g13444.t1
MMQGEAADSGGITLLPSRTDEPCTSPPALQRRGSASGSPTVKQERCAFVLLDRGRNSGFQPIPPATEDNACLTYHLVSHRQFKLQPRDPGESATWARRRLQLSLVYADDGTPVRHGTGVHSRVNNEEMDLPLRHYTLPRRFERVLLCTLPLDDKGTTVHSFSITAASHRHGGRLFRLYLVDADTGAPIPGRILVHTRSHPSRSAGIADLLQRLQAPDAVAAAAAAAAAATKRPRGARGASTAAGTRGSPRGWQGPGTGPRSRQPSFSECSSDGDASFEDEEYESSGSADDAAAGPPKRATAQAGGSTPKGTPEGLSPCTPIVALEGLGQEKVVNAEVVEDVDSSDEGSPPGPGAGEGQLFDVDAALDALELSLRTGTGLRITDEGPSDGAAGGGDRPASATFGEELFWITAEDARRLAVSYPSRSPPLYLPDAEHEELCAAFRRLNDPVALESRMTVRNLVTLLLDPRVLASRLYRTFEGRYALRRAFHNLREASAYPAVGVIVESAVDAVCAIPPSCTDPADAEAMLDLCYGLLLAGTSEIAPCSPDLAYLSWGSTKRLLAFAEAVAGPWRGQDRALHCRVLHRRAIAFFHHGFTDAALELGFESWSELIRSQHTPSRIEAAVLRDLVEMHLYAGRMREVRQLADRLYYFPGETAEDVFLEAQVNHLLAIIVNSVHKRPKKAIALASSAVAAFERIPDEAYRHYGARTVGLRSVLCSQAGKLRTSADQYVSMLKHMSSTHEVWSTLWDQFFVLRYAWLHSPVAPPPEGVFAPLPAMLRFMGLFVFVVPLLDKRRATPILGHAQYQLGVAYLRAGANAKALASLERAHAYFRAHLPKHFPPSSPRMQAIEAALREARARTGGPAGAGSPKGAGPGPPGWTSSALRRAPCRRPPPSPPPPPSA